jgi:antitoxin component of MazEF toxin-antitoxin module
MREFLTKTRKIGDSIAVILPRDILEAEQIKENMDVKIIIQKTPKGFSVSKPKNAEDDPWRLLE